MNSIPEINKNNQNIIPSELLDLMADLIEKYIQRKELWRDSNENAEKLININDAINNIYKRA